MTKVLKQRENSNCSFVCTNTHVDSCAHRFDGPCAYVYETTELPSSYYLLIPSTFTDASCNFDIWYCGWDNGPGNFNWTRKFGRTPSTNTGPSGDHTGGGKL